MIHHRVAATTARPAAPAPATRRRAASDSTRAGCGSRPRGAASALARRCVTARAGLVGSPASSTPDEDDFWQRYEQLEDEDSIGSEWGEGFVQYRPSGQPLHVDVEHLNATMQSAGLERLRHALRPDEAFGTIIVLEGIVLDTRSLQAAMWKSLAAEEGLRLPSISRPVHNVRPERVISEVYQWATDWKDVRRLAFRAAEIHGLLLEGAAASGAALPATGLAPWLAALAKNNMPVAVVTKMSKRPATALLETLGLRQHVRCVVSQEDGMETKAQRLLSAAVKLGRAPRSCVVFEADPRGVTAAHNASMKAVGITTAVPAYEFAAADLTVASLAELSIVNVRRLWAADGTQLMDLAKERAQGVGRRRAGARLDVMDRPEEDEGDDDD